MQDHHLLSDSLAAVINWLKRAREDMASYDEIAHLSPSELKEIADDCGLSVEQFVTIARKGPHAADELDKMLAALGIRKASIDRNLQRDLTIVCADCQHKKACRKSLARGDAANDFHDFCANADALEKLRA